MSLSALNWALRTSAGSSSRKLVLLVLANYSNEHGEAYPSVETIADLAELNAKTVRSALAELIAEGLIRDTGKRCGRTQNIRVWALQIPSETLPKTEPFQKRNPTVFGPETLPKTDPKPYQNWVGDTKEDTGYGYRGNNNLTYRDTRGYRTQPRGLTARPPLRSLDGELDRPLSATEIRVRKAQEFAERYFSESDRREQEELDRFYDQQEGRTIE